MRILVIGGTGFIGTPLTARLLARGHEVAVFSRGRKPVPENVMSIKGERGQINGAAARIDQFEPEVVIDIFAMTDAETRPVFELMAERHCRFVMISSCDVYRVFGQLLGNESGPKTNDLQSETSPLRQTSYPYRAIPNSRAPDYDKIPLEALLFELFDTRGTVMRLPMIVGAGDPQHRFRDPVKHMADQRPILLLPQVYANWTTTYGHIRNVIEAIVVAAEDPRSSGEIFNVADGAHRTQMEWYQAVADTMKWSGEIVMAEAKGLPEKRAAFELGTDFSHDLRIDAAKLRSQLKFQPVIDLDSALEDIIKWETAHLGEIDETMFDYCADDAWLATQALEV